MDGQKGEKNIFCKNLEILVLFYNAVFFFIICYRFQTPMKKKLKKFKSQKKMFYFHKVLFRFLLGEKFDEKTEVCLTLFSNTQIKLFLKGKKT